MRHKCLSIAGFDGSGGAGIQADIKTFSATGSYALTVLTALPIQNTCGVTACYEIGSKQVEAQLISIFEDITPDAIKIGMLANAHVIEVVATCLSKFATNIPMVLDPVMVATSGDRLLDLDAIDILKHKLIPMADLITPNLPEAKCLQAKNSTDNIDLDALIDLGCKAVLLKGGHAGTDHAIDWYVTSTEKRSLSSPWIHTKNTHGTGCTLSAAITSFVAQGMPMMEACQHAKNYITKAIQASCQYTVGKGAGPVHHFYAWWD